MDGMHHILHVCTIYLMYIYVCIVCYVVDRLYTYIHICGISVRYKCVCVVWYIFSVSFPLHYLYFQTQIRLSGETGGRNPHISKPRSVVKSRVMNIHCDSFNFSLNSEYWKKGA